MSSGNSPILRGALKRVIQRHLQNPLATMILEGGVGTGETVRISAAEDSLAINGVLIEAA